MRTLAGLALVAASFGLGGAAAAKPAPEEAARLPSWKESHLAVNDPAMRAVYIIAVCTRNHRRAAAEALLEAAPGSAEEGALIQAAIPSGETECPIQVSKVRIHSHILMRGAIAEAIYNGEGTRPRTDAALPPPEPLDAALAASPTPLAWWVARCAVRQAPARAQKVVSYNPGDFSEGKALDALRPTLLACLPPGSRLQMDRQNFRAMIAEELYHASRRYKESFRNAQS